MRRWLQVALLLAVLAAIGLALPDQGLWPADYRGGGSPALHKHSEPDRTGARPAPRWLPTFPARRAPAFRA
jgi:hypothetical protein